MIVEVELSDLSTDNYIELQKISKAITRQLKDEILVTPKLRLVKKGSLPQSEGKAVRVKDLRDNKSTVKKTLFKIDHLFTRYRWSVLYKHIIYLPLTHHLFQHHVSSFHNHPHPHKTKEERLSKQITVPLL